MDDIVAVRVELDTGEHRYFITWGRLHDVVDPRPLAHVILANAHHFSLGGKPIQASVCDSLSEASGAPYFFEGLLAISRESIPFGPGYEEWRKSKLEAMAKGREIHFLGRKDLLPDGRPPDARIDDGYTAPR